MSAGILKTFKDGKRPGFITPEVREARERAGEKAAAQREPLTPTEIVLKAILDRKAPDPATLPPLGSYLLELSLRVDQDSVRLCGVLDGQVMMVRLGGV